MRTLILHALAFVPALTLLAQTPRPRPPEPAEFQALQAHFDRAVAARHANAFKGITSVPQWEQRKQQLRQELSRMLWHDYQWPATPPAARITNRTEYPAYTLENIVLETAPKVYSTANLYLPRTGAKP